FASGHIMARADWPAPPRGRYTRRERGYPNKASPERWFLMLGLIIYLLFIGIVAGFLARLLVPGRDPMGFWATVLLGVIGSFVGGFLGYVLFEEDVNEGPLRPSGIFGSIIGAIIVLLVYRAVSGRRRHLV